MDKVGVEGDASKSRTFLLSYLWLPVRGAAAASSDIVTCCNLQAQAPGTCIIVFFRDVFLTAFTVLIRRTLESISKQVS